MRLWRVCAAAVALAASAAPSQTVERTASASARALRLPVLVGGRVLRTEKSNGSRRHLRQWPATYFETAFRGRSALFRIGSGEVALRITVDGDPSKYLVRPEAGTYRVGGLAAGRHRLRIDVVSESQGGPTEFGGFYATPGTSAEPIASRARRMEFIGDSHTVGYSNSSTKRDCTEEEVWRTTDASRGVGPLTAARYGADYQVNAISGRGIVRNYGGGAGDTLPEAYPYVLLNKEVRFSDPDWRPQVIAISLGTNDFSTAPRPGERWADPEAVGTDYEATYLKFVQRLRARNPGAFFILWATDILEGAIGERTEAVVNRWRATGEHRVAYVPVRSLAFSACHHHPGLQDDQRIASALSAFIDANPDVWR